MIATNVRATESLLRLAHAAGVERIVYTSSVAALRVGAEGRTAGRRERTPITYDKVVGTYKKSKFLAEQVALKLSDEGIPVDDRQSRRADRAGRCEADAHRRHDPRRRDGPHAGLSSIPGSASCMSTTAPPAICWRWTDGIVGERYILGGENISMGEVLALVDEVTGNSEAAGEAADRAAGARRLSSRSRWRALTGQRAAPDPRPPQDGAQDDVFLLRQGRGRTRLHAIARFRGGARCHRRGSTGAMRR